MAKTLNPVRPSAGVRALYQKRLEAMVDELHRSVSYWVLASYRANKPLAMDATPAQELRAALRKLTRRWQAKIDALAPKLAAYFAKAASERIDGEMARLLREAGFTVRFRMSRAQRDALNAVIGQNVSLIKSVGERHLADVEGIVMRSVEVGRDLATLSTELQERYKLTRRRAALIARHQNNMATSTLERARQRELGIKEAIWLHSAGGKHPRPEHLAFSGKRYDVDKGAWLEGKWTWPGREINCRCVSKAIIPGFDD